MRSVTGTVVSNKMDKTIVVRVDHKRAHPKYKKTFTVSKKFYAHDPENKFNIGDSVTIFEQRPLSKLKRWTVVQPEVKPDKTPQL